MGKMTAGQVLTQVDSLLPNAYTREEKLRWLLQAEGTLIREVLRPVDRETSVPEKLEESTVLVAETPYDGLYDLYVQAQIPLRRRRHGALEQRYGPVESGRGGSAGGNTAENGRNADGKLPASLLKGGGGMFFPMLKKIGLEKMTVTDFPGLDRRETARIGGFREMRNLCGEGYPTLRTRQARGLIATVTKPGGLTAKDALIWVDGTRICVNGEAAGPVLTEGEKDLISMGAYLIVFPDKVYLNTKDLTDYGSLECERTASAGVAISLCDAEGKAYSGVVQSVGAPEDPEEGTLWMDVSGAEPVLRQYGQECWTALQNVCVKLQANLLGKGFAAGDGVTVSGCAAARLNGEKVLQAAGENWVVFPGIVAGNASQEAAVTISRTVPEMDFVVESGNRLWGCRYGMTDGEAVNEYLRQQAGGF